ncbi:beta strand repeat-containing protein, partial [Pseudomonadota bacterium]
MKLNKIANLLERRVYAELRKISPAYTLFVISLFCIAMPAESEAAIYYANQTADQADGGDCTNPGNSDCSLRDAISAANGNAGADTINVASGTFTLTRSGIDDTNSSGDLDITEAVTITGAGKALTTISNSISNERVFHVTNTSVLSISAVKIAVGHSGNNSANDGGVIYTSGNLNIDDSDFDGRTASTSDDARRGGAIFITSTGYLTVTNTTFDDFESDYDAGAIYMSGGGLMEDVTFQNNHSNANFGTAYTNKGGAIYNETNALTIQGTSNVFLGNLAPIYSDDHGGTIYSSGDLSITNGDFDSDGNTTSDADQGGSIYMEAATTLTLDTVSFENFVADLNGGTIYSHGGTFTDVTFTGSQSKFGAGGAIYSASGALTINGTTNVFTSNFIESASLGDYGGNIYSAGNLSVLNATFTARNNADVDAYWGGAIYMDTGATLTLDTASFSNYYTSQYGGAVYSRGGTMTDVSFTGNHTNGYYGGAIYNVDSALTINGVSNDILSNTFSSNYCNSSYGGSIYTNVNLDITNATFAGDGDGTSDATSGGAIYMSTGTLDLTNVSFSDFRSSGSGAAVSARGGTFEKVTFDGNYTTTGSGGAVYNATNPLTIQGTSNVFSNNYTNNGNGDGGSIYSSNIDLTISNATFSGNNDATADSRDGGAIFMATGGSLSLTNVSFSDLYAASDGGAVYARGGTFTDVSFTNNHTLNNLGGAIYNVFSPLTITGSNNVFDSNYAGTGSTNHSGGTIYFAGYTNLSIDNAVFTGNNDATADGYKGGAIYAHSSTTFTLTDSSFKDFLSGSAGGAIYQNSGSLDINRVTFESNTANLLGGGAVYAVVSPINITNSTFSDNNTNVDGGALYVSSSGTTNIKHTTFSDNYAVGTSEVIHKTSGTAAIDHSIVTNSSVDGVLCTNVGSSGYNVQFNGTCFGESTGDRSTTDPQLQGLANNGGVGRTHAIPNASVAVDRGVTDCSAAPVSNVDQRGVSRPIDGNDDTFFECDSGAYEWEPTITLTGTIYSDKGVSNVGSGVTVAAVVNGSNKRSIATIAGGTYSLEIGEPSAGDVLTLYIDDHGTYNATTVTVVDGTAPSTLNLYHNHLITRFDNGAGSLNNANLSTADDGDTDIVYSVTGSDLDTNAGTELLIWSGNTFTPAGIVSADGVDINGTFDAAANAVNVTGAWDATGGVFTSTGTVTLNATSGSNTITPGGTGENNDFHNLIINDGGGSATFVLGGALDVNNDFTITNGILNSTGSNYAVTVGGNFSQAAAAQFEAFSSVIEVTGNFTADGTTDSTDYNNTWLKMLGNGSTLTFNNLTQPWNNGFGQLTVGQTSGQIDTIVTTSNQGLAIGTVLHVGVGEVGGSSPIFLRGGPSPLDVDQANSTISVDTLKFFATNQNLPPLDNGYDANIRVSGPTSLT